MASMPLPPRMDLVTLPHHVEFLTDGWIEALSRFMRETVPVRKMMGQAGAPFSVSERFTDAPPHLKLPNNVATYTLRFDGESATVSREFDEDADLTLQGDYQQALTTLAQFVGVLVPGGQDEMWREAHHLFGKDAFRIKGKLPDDQAATLMGLAHDHMARRTVENPDLEHRARRLGLIGNIRDMEENGFTVIERAISPGMADDLRNTIKHAVIPGAGVSQNWMLYQGRACERVTLNPLQMTLVDASLGRGAQLASNAAIVRGPGKGFIDIHTDYTDVPEPYPEFAMSGVAVWALEDWTEKSGGTWIIPGSHRRRRAPRPGEGSNEGVPTVMPKGSVVFFTQGVWHWQGFREEPGERVTLHPHFNRGILRSVEQKRPDVQMAMRNPPRLGEMMGEDDWFDKMGPNGRDHVRLEHMRQLHAFTNHKMRVIRGEKVEEELVSA